MRSAAEYAAPLLSVHRPGPLPGDDSSASGPLPGDGFSAVVAEDTVFESDSELQQSIHAAKACAEQVADLLRDQLDDRSLRRLVYPHGTLVVTTAADHSAGLALLPAPVAAAACTVHRQFGGGSFDVAAFSGQPRATLVCLPHDERNGDEIVALRAATLMHRDVQWAMPSYDEDDEDDEVDEIRIGVGGRYAAEANGNPPVTRQPRQGLSLRT